MRQHLILIGLPGAGKSTAGRLLAERLGTHCTDIDPNIERATGMTIAELFLEEGERSFRVRERRAVAEALGLPPHVIAPGGGWAAEPGNLPDVVDRCLPIHLAVRPEVAAVRLRGDHTRPLVGADDPNARLTALWQQRQAAYRSAPVEVDVSDRSAEQVADLLLEIARSRAGWVS